MAYRKDLTAPPGTPKDAILREFGQRLTKMMTERGWNQSDTAREATRYLPADLTPMKRSGKKVKRVVGRDLISNWCNAKVWPTPVMLKAVAEALGTTQEELLPLVNPRNVDKLTTGMEIKSLGDGTVNIYLSDRVPAAVAFKIQELVLKAKKQI